MDEFKRLANSRKGYRIHLKKLLVKSADIIQRRREFNESNIPCLTDLCDLRDQLNRKDELISALDAEIMKLITNEDDLVSEVSEAEDIKEAISTSIAHLTQIINTVSKPTPVTVHPSNVETPPTRVETDPSDPPRVIPVTDPVSASHEFTRLSKFNIPTFAGDTLQWQSFWDCFEAAVHHNRAITNVQKLNYLRAQL